MPNSDSDDYSTTDSTDSLDEDERRLAQQEWEEGVQQLQQLVSVLLLPFLGKFLGRKWSHWLFARYQRLGLGKLFFFGETLLLAASRR